jgi:hypothetical protein
MFFNPTLVPSGDNIPPIDSSVFSNIPDIVLCLITSFINEIRKSIVEIHVLYYAFKVDIAYVSPHKNHIFLWGSHILAHDAMLGKVISSENT